MTSKFLIPLQLAELTRVQAQGIEEGIVKFYLRDGALRIVRPGENERDVVLDRKLEGFVRDLSGLPVTKDDTVLTALQKIGNGGGDAVLEEDVPVIGVEVGGVKTGDEFKEGDTLTEIIKRIMTKRIVQGYTQPSANLSTVPAERVYEVGVQLVNVNVRLNFLAGDAGRIRTQNITDSEGPGITSGLLVLPTLLLKETPRVFTGEVYYEDGAIKPDNFGVIDPDDPGRIRAGVVRAEPVFFQGLYPILFGSTNSPGEVTGLNLYTAGNRKVAVSGSEILIPSFGTGARYLWWAVPRLIAPRYNFWRRTALDAGRIGDPTDLFNAPFSMDVSSSGLTQNWTVSYAVYATLSPTEADLPTSMGVASLT